MYFVTRLKRNADIEVLESFLANEKHDHILSDEDITLSGFYSSQRYHGPLQVVEVYDKNTNQHLLSADQQFILDSRHHISVIQGPMGHRGVL